MDVELAVPEDADISIIEEEYSDLYFDDTYDGTSHYFIGKSSDEYEDGEDAEWMTRDEAVAFCGFCAGALPDSSTMLEGNGPWAQGQLRSEPIYLEARQKGEAARQRKENERSSATGETNDSTHNK